jgi:hypothetical protein
MIALICHTILFFEYIKTKVSREKKTIIGAMRVTNMKYVINIKRKPSIIKKEKRE